MYRGLLFVFLFLSSLSSYGQRMTYRVFDNIMLSVESSGVNCFAQDSLGNDMDGIKQRIV